MDSQPIHVGSACFTAAVHRSMDCPSNARAHRVDTSSPTTKGLIINRIFGPSGRILGGVVQSDREALGRAEGDIVDSEGGKVGEVHRAGGGGVSDAKDWFVGEVFANGVVEDDNANEIGYVRERSVYDRSGALVGTVDASTVTTWMTGISDAHKAGAALLLLLRHR